MLLTVLKAVWGILLVALHAFWSVFVLVWWVVVPPILFYALAHAWLFYKQEKSKSSIKWVLLELTPPREVPQTAKAMEQVFAAMHEMYSFGIPFTWKWFKGTIEDWASFELVGRAGVVHFYVRIPGKYRDMVEAAIYAHYPDVEITLVSDEDDYIRAFPTELPEEYMLFGSEIILARDDGYPIKTYPEFDELVEERRIDPISVFTEIMSRLEGSETLWIQFLIRPTGTEWTKKSQELIDILLGKKKKPEKKKHFAWTAEKLQGLGEFGINLMKAPLVQPVWAEKKDDKKEEKPMNDANRRVIQAIEEKMSKIGFEAGIRYVFIDRKEGFAGSNISALAGAFMQFSTLHLNALKPNLATMTIALQPFKKWKVTRKRRLLYQHYRARDFLEKSSIFNTEELATLFHFPLTAVKSPMLQRVGARRASPPSDLPSF